MSLKLAYLLVKKVRVGIKSYVAHINSAISAMKAPLPYKTRTKEEIPLYENATSCVKSNSKLRFLRQGTREEDISFAVTLTYFLRLRALKCL